MKTRNLALVTLAIISIGSQASAAGNKKAAVSNTRTAEWTMLTYIAADNSLAPYATYNMNDMAAGIASTNNVNILVQWDKPSDNKSWRYKITPGGKIESGSVSSEMGYDPAKELVASMQWAKKSFPAKRYALILWDHGSGVEDFEPGVARNIALNPRLYTSWLQLPGYAPAKGRGILYDDTQSTCLTNQGLTTALGQIKTLLGKKIDIVATDACLMAMVEVAYQMKDLVTYFVGSEQTIPGYGYPYSKFIRPLSQNPAGTSALQLAQAMVNSYQQYYTTQEPTPDRTLSTIDVTSIGLIKQNIDQFIAAVNACAQLDAEATKSMIVAARQGASSFAMDEYIDLYSFYAGILGRMKKTSPKSHAILAQRQKAGARSEPSRAYQDALATLDSVIQDGITKITTVVVHNAVGPVYAGCKGISIYYPDSGPIHSSYSRTLFAQDTAWTNFVLQYR